MSFEEHRKRLYRSIPDNSLIISYAGVPLHTNEDDYYNFEVNSQFFYLTGLERENMAFAAAKTGGSVTEMLFIEEADALMERWTGKMPAKEEASAVSGVKDVRYTSEFDSSLGRIMGRCLIENVYFDLYRCGLNDLPDYNALKADEFAGKYPGVKLCDLHRACVPLREIKDEDEIACIRKAVDITRQGLEHVMKVLKPGMMEYQAQAEFEYMCRYLGTKKFSFNTISGSGLNGCMMHYVTNHCEIKDGSLLLMDLGAKYGNYCSDITRTYPANGRYTPRQKEIYNLVLKANKAVAEAARPGVTLRELNDLTRKILGEGLVELGLISSWQQVGKYYMHGVSHAIGIDCHDADFAGDILKPGWVISDEPGLYIDEEEIGIRIEDDLLITENGCEVLSRDIIRETDEIEAFMQKMKSGN
ncbi:MAG: aminopeptidase P family protein [Solobacterium sp.]|nr:aminopeptidase P family protein [Solobacterium sp.]